MAYLALTDAPVSRAKVVALFWPNRDEERARNALNQAVHYLRRSLAKGAVVSVEGDRIQVPPSMLSFDVRELLSGASIPTGDASFFDGWNADDSQPLQEWIDSVRRRVEQEVASRAETLASPDVADTPTRLRSWQRTSWVGAALAALVLVVIVVGAMRPSAPPLLPEPDLVYVLRPLITAEEPVPEGLEGAIQDEILAALTGLNLGRVVPLSLRDFAQTARFAQTTRFVEGQADQDSGAVDDDALVVRVSLRIGEDSARSVIVIRQLGPISAARSEATTHPLPARTSITIDLPQAIAGQLEGWLPEQVALPR